jgi:hypothetical protein
MNPRSLRYLAHFILVVCLAGMAPLLDAQTRSAKRGVSANSLNTEQVGLLAPGISWIYNWGATPGNLALNGEIEYIPMIWRAEQGWLDDVKAYLDSGATPPFVLFSNEPNFAFPLGSNTIPEEVSDMYAAALDTLESYGVTVIGPNMALGSEAEDSVTAYDPCKDATITYTTFQTYLDAFDCFNDRPLEGIGVHAYGGIGELKWAVDTFYARYGKPVWMTEFAFAGASPAALKTYMLEALDYLERSPKVAGYAWFKAEQESQPGLTDVHLVTVGSRGNPIELTELGQIYVNFPAYDPEYYHPVPGRIEAESYLEADNLSIEGAYDPAGVAAMFAGRQSGNLTFQINVSEAGRYRLRMRISSPAYGDVPPPAEPGDPTPPTGKERDLYFETEFVQGEQIFKIMFKGLSAQIDWLEFKKLP